MIYDAMERLVNYRGICPMLDLLIDRLTMQDGWKTLPAGRTEVLDDRAYINRSLVALQAEPPLFEIHRMYGDIHVAITGGETIACAPAESIAWPESGDETLVAAGRAFGSIAMEPGMFAIFFPWDAHRPSVGSGTCDKLVGKFRLDAMEA